MKRQSVTWNLSLLLLLSFSIPLLGQKQLDEATTKLRTLYFQRDYAGGYVEGKKLVARFPEALELRAWLILNMARNDMAEEAAAAAEEIVAANENSPWSWFALAGALNWQQERGEEALSASEKALAMLPDHPDVIWLRAETLMRQDKKDEAVAFVDQQRAKLKNPAELLATKGNALYALAMGRTVDEAKLEAAFAAFAEARTIDPSNVSAHYIAGTYLARLHRNTQAYPLLKTALALSPNATSIHTQLWQAVMGLKEKSPEEKHAEIEADIRAFLQNRSTYPDALSAVALIYGELKLAEKRRAMEEQILEQFPESREAEWMLVHRYRNFRAEAGQEGFQDPGKQQQYRQMLRDFIKRPHHHQEGLLGDAYRGLFYSIQDDSTIHADELLEVVNGMAKYEGINPHVAFAKGAIALAERKSHFREAERIARDGIPAAKQRIESQRRSYETQGDYENALNWMTGLMYDALGWVFFNEGRIDEAEKELLHAYDLDHENLENLYHLGQLHEAKGNPDQAGEFYIKGMSIQRPGENPNARALKALYEKRHGSLEGIDDYLARINEIERAKRQEKVLASRIAEPEAAPPFDLKTPDGSLVSLESLKGKIVVINFWGIWCGWCVIEMPDFQKLHEKYKDDPDVAILTINNDANPDDVPPWLQKNGYNFAVLIDDGYVNKANVRSFPTTWFLDPHGRKAFVKAGWSEKLLEEFIWRIEALRKANP
jgi:tetratricopeptide (TPR) repeat protein